ncbi:unnamed protein product [Acanthosepion pharaonis]|uniref:Uncharacterized protein n=1 Tax=Acanthosepion pharaonis TaxID=158019 RepID=A0A812DZR9_ACAPH|nr:unnamed protein product [Sepia pharaonis]
MISFFLPFFAFSIFQILYSYFYCTSFFHSFFLRIFMIYFFYFLHLPITLKPKPNPTTSFITIPRSSPKFSPLHHSAPARPFTPTNQHTFPKATSLESFTSFLLFSRTPFFFLSNSFSPPSLFLSFSLSFFRSFELTLPLSFPAGGMKDGRTGAG